MADEPAPDYIWILGLPGGEEEDEERFLGFRRDDVRVLRDKAPVSRLQENLANFVSAMGEAMQAVPRTLAGFSVDSIELSLEVSATGTVSLLGSGGEVSGTGGITLTLTRVPAEN